MMYKVLWRGTHTAKVVKLEPRGIFGRFKPTGEPEKVQLYANYRDGVRIEHFRFSCDTVSAEKEA